jgi:ABC-type multidrug transport system fused ATPase/permease subunit
MLILIIFIICTIIGSLRFFSIKEYLNDSEIGKQYGSLLVSEILKVSWGLNFLVIYLIGLMFYFSSMFMTHYKEMVKKYDSIEMEVKNLSKQNMNLYQINKKYYYYTDDGLKEYEEDNNKKQILEKELQKLDSKTWYFWVFILFSWVVSIIVLFIFLIGNIITPWVGGYYKEKWRIKSILDSYQNSFNNIINRKL